MSFFHRGVRKDALPKSSSVLSVIHLIYGKPRAGKSYYFAEKILKSKKMGRQIVTNFAIYGCGAKKWDDRLLRGSYVYDTDIYIDEAYTLFNSRNYKGFTLLMHEFFSMLGHCGNRIFLIAQFPGRIDVIIREVTTYFIEVSAIRIPGRNQPVLFLRKYYDVDPCDIANEGQKRMIKPAHVEWAWFRKKVAHIYDTQACRPAELPLELVSWDDDNSNE